MSRDDIVLKSGKTVYANRLILGISLAEREAERPLFNGYDGEIWLSEYVPEADDYVPAYTQEELFELADLAIARWNWFKQQVREGKIESSDYTPTK